MSDDGNRQLPNLFPPHDGPVELSLLEGIWKPRPLPNLFQPLDAEAEAILREGIRRRGVRHPITLDQYGRILDGFNRKRIADELGLECPTEVIEVQDDDEARALSVMFNLGRRHLAPERRRELVSGFREQGLSLRAIAERVGVSEGTVRNDLRPQVRSGYAPESERPDGPAPEPAPGSERVTGRDGKSYPAERPAKRRVSAPPWSQLLQGIAGRLGSIARDHADPDPKRLRAVLEELPRVESEMRRALADVEFEAGANESAAREALEALEEAEASEGRRPS
jgi:transposase